MTALQRDSRAMDALIRFAYSAFRPPKKQKVSEWADENRWLVSQSSSEAGRWRSSRAPYQIEMMDSFNDARVWKIVIKSSSQVGKSEVELNMIGWVIDNDPGPILYVQPSEDIAEDYSKRRIAPMIEAAPTLRGKVSEAKGRDSNNTILMKTFPGGSLALTGANSPRKLASKPVRYIFMDEVDGFPKTSGSEGDPIMLANRRTETFRHNRKIVMTSSPTIRGESPIEEGYLEGTQEEWHTQCPNCKAWRFIKFDQIRFEWEKREEGGFHVFNVRWQCPDCMKEYREVETKRFRGKWVAHNPAALEDGVRSFWINAFMSPWSSWAEIAEQFLKSKDSPDKLKVFLNTYLGELWDVKEQTREPDTLFGRRETYDAEVPDGVLCLTMGIDTQRNRLEYEVVGWDDQERSWGIRYGIIPVRPTLDEAWEELDAIITKEYTLKNGKTMKISRAFIDSGGDYTSEIYRRCMKRYHMRLYPIKGEPGQGRELVRRMKKPELAQLNAYIIGVDDGKEAIMNAVGEESPEKPYYMHFPNDDTRGYDMYYFRGLISERVEWVKRNGRERMRWTKFYERNEPLDCRNYARAAYKSVDFNFEKRRETYYGNDEPKITRKKKSRDHVISRGVI